MIHGFGPNGSPDSLFHLSATPEFQFIIKVNKNHPDAPALALAAGVDMSRMDRPVFTFHREHHLVNRPELDKALGKSPGYVPLAGGPSYEEQRFVWDRSWWYEKWTGLLRHGVQFVAGKDGLPVVKEENSVIALSMGPHWSPRELWPADFEEKPDTYDFVVRGFQGAVSCGGMVSGRVLMGCCSLIRSCITSPKRPSRTRSPLGGEVTLRVIMNAGNTINVSQTFCLRTRLTKSCLAENDRTDQLSTRDPTLQSYNW